MGGFVIYDLETTGLHPRFDQILQFAAIRTDEELNPIEEVELRGRLLPNLVPSPSALDITGARLEDISDPERPSHFDLTCKVHDTLTQWSPAMFLGFNSIKFDEEFLRQAFYMCLKQPIYVTNAPGNTRGDVIKLARAAAILSPQALKVPTNEQGRRAFALTGLAKANGIDPGRPHEAMSDARTTLALCRLIREANPELWSSFMRFANKSATLNFIRDQEAFGVFETAGGAADYRCASRIGVSSNDPNAHFVLDLGHDVERLRGLNHTELIGAIRDERAVWKLKINASPILTEIWEIESHLPDGQSEPTILELAQSVRSDPEFLRRLNAAAVESEPVWPPSPYVETQIYNDFVTDPDAARCRTFHTLPWDERVAHAATFQDPRLRRIAQRLIFFERPELMSEARRAALAAEIERRVCGLVPDAPWLTIPKALDEIQIILDDSLELTTHHPLLALKAALSDRLARMVG
ncbi:exonuclease domain-containing protein [Brevundimonas sp.]|uniref:exonuclease domain-containing protein n=1 Tax=Brevundimonas sp. TaxID=1871086 RepID=UPI003D10CA29